MWPFKPKNLTLADYQGWPETFGLRATGSGAVVTPESAMKQSAVYACVRVLSETVASLPIQVYETRGDTRQAVDHPLNNLLGGVCNGEQTGFVLREFMMSCLNLRGNAYAQKVYTNGGRLAAINPLNARYMNVDRDGSGRLMFDYQETGNARVFTVDEIWRVAGLSGDGVLGLSPITLARETIGLAVATEGHGASTLKNGVNPSITLEMDGRLSDEAFKRLQEQIDQNKAGFGNAGKPFIAEEGMKAKAIGMTNVDAQFLESRKFQAEEIARWYRVPPHMVGILDKATFSNIEQQSIDFVQNTIRPWLVRIEASAQRDLFSNSERGRYHLSHSVEGLLRGDTAARYQAYGSAIDKGWMNRNEVRRLERLQPVDGLSEHVLPVNVETITEREERFARNVSNMLADQEINALRAEIKKGEGYEGRMADFYARFAGKLEDNGVSKEDAEGYAFNRIEQIKNKQTDKIERTALHDLAGII